MPVSPCRTRKSIAKGIAVTAMLTIVLISCFICSDRDEGPRYSGESLGFWLRNSALIGQNNMRAEESPGFLDSNAVPFLIRALGRRDGVLQKSYNHIYSNVPYSVRRHLNPPVEGARIREVAVVYLALLGKQAEPAIPTIVELWMQDEDIGVRAAAAASLIKIGQSNRLVESAFMDAFTNQDPQVRRMALTSLCSLPKTPRL